MCEESLGEERGLEKYRYTIYIVSNVQTGSSMDEHLDNFYVTIFTRTEKCCSSSLNNMTL